MSEADKMSIETLEDVIRPGTMRGLDFVIIKELKKRTGIRLMSSKESQGSFSSSIGD